MVTGVRGIGKTALLKEYAQWLDEQEAWTVSVAAPPGTALLGRLATAVGDAVLQHDVGARAAKKALAILRVAASLALRFGQPDWHVEYRGALVQPGGATGDPGQDVGLALSELCHLARERRTFVALLVDEAQNADTAALALCSMRSKKCRARSSRPATRAAVASSAPRCPWPSCSPGCHPCPRQSGALARRSWHAPRGSCSDPWRRRPCASRSPRSPNRSASLGMPTPRTASCGSPAATLLPPRVRLPRVERRRGAHHHRRRGHRRRSRCRAAAGRLLQRPARGAHGPPAPRCAGRGLAASGPAHADRDRAGGGPSRRLGTRVDHRWTRRARRARRVAHGRYAFQIPGLGAYLRADA